MRLCNVQDVKIPSTFIEKQHPHIMSNSSNPTPPARGGGLSLYANLLDPDGVTSSATVSKGPVVFKPAESTDEAAKKPQIDSGIYYPNRPVICHLANLSL
jgi:hypothetical protein